MDRPLDGGYTRRRTAKRLAKAAGLTAAVVVAFAGARSLLSPSVSRASLRTARAEIGPVEASLSAPGTVVPERDEVLTSSVDARVVRVLLRPGAVLAAGDAILELDVAEAVLQLGKLEESLALKERDEARAALELVAALDALAGQAEIKRLELATRTASLARSRKLFAEGLVSEELLRQSELDEARVRLELSQVGEARRLAERKGALDRNALALESRTLRKEKLEMERQLRLATTRAAKGGVLTAVLPEAGARVHKGDVLARIADLSTYRVEATVSDVHAARLRTGLPAKVAVSGRTLAAEVARVLPTIQNGAQTLELRLEERSDPSLKPNLRVDVEIVFDAKPKALRVRRGAFLSSGASPELFVVEGDAARRRAVRFGLLSADWIEVLSGLAEGDEVVLSDMSEWAHLSRVGVSGSR